MKYMIMMNVVGAEPYEIFSWAKDDLEAHMAFLNDLNEELTAAGASSLGPNLQREELSGEAIRLVHMMRRELPEDPEVAGLLALMLLTAARRPARTGAHGELVPLAEQSRSLWRESMIAEGVALVDDAFSRGRVGQYQIQAAVAALHDQAASVEDTDWRQILALVRGHLLHMAGRAEEARIAYEIAAGRADNVQERDYLLLKVAELGDRTREEESLEEER